MQRKKIKNEELGRLEIEAFKNARKYPLAVVLDSVRSLNNVGSAFRTCDAFLIEKIYLTGITGIPPHREINKTALGATESVDWEYRESIVSLVKDLKSQGYVVIAIEQVHGGKMLNQFQPERDAKYALIFGNEVNGVDEEALQLVDDSIEIPQYGTKHSLNVGVSIGVVIWDLVNKLEQIG